jgi:hypothetical protein
MEVILVRLPRYLDFFCILAGKLGCRFYYLTLSPSPDAESLNRRVTHLKNNGIVPLPLADLPHFEEYSGIHTDPHMKVFERTRSIAPIEFTAAFRDLFSGITDVEKKLQIAVHSPVTVQYMNVGGKIRIWARSNPDTTYLLIDLNVKGLLNPDLASNVWQVVIPLEIFETGFRLGFLAIHNAILAIKTGLTPKKTSSVPSPVPDEQKPPARVAYVTHKGLQYGNMYQKNLFYSPRKESELHAERLLHIDYSGVPNPSEKLHWVCLGERRASYPVLIWYALVASGKGIFRVRHVRHLFGLMILTRFYVGYRSYLARLDAYPDLGIALIDYDMLCPKELLLAFESRKIKTVAVQERFLGAFAKLFASIFLDTSLCSSPLTGEAMRKNPIICIDHYIPVGQYRTDTLLEAKNSPPPEIFKKPLARGWKIITALGYQAPLEWQNSQADLMINWCAHQHFLDDMIRLSEDIPDVFIILRYKDVDWITLPVFADTIRKIQSSENITISTDYSKDFASYDICAHSDLIIAKYSSLADECLSVGIPVLYHEYTHNTVRIIADAYDYSPAKILCFNYQELKEKVRKVIKGMPAEMAADYAYLKNITYGDMSDGCIRKRIHSRIEEMIAELPGSPVPGKTDR